MMTLFEIGNVSLVKALAKSEEDPLVSFDTVIEGADSTGWEAVLEDNGAPRAVKTDRIIEGFFSSERLDSQNDVVPLSAFIVEKDNEDGLPLIEYIAKRAPLIYEHANTEKGVVPLGAVVGYKVEDDKPKFRWAIYKGSPLVDEVWEEMKKHGKDGGFSIGGAKIEPQCDSHKCVLNKLDVVEISWTPNPANTDAKATFINRMAKSKKEDEDMEKPCPHKKTAEAIKASDMSYDDKKTALSALKGSNLPKIQTLIDEGEAIQPLEPKEDDEDEEKVKYSKSTGAELSPSDSTNKEGDTTTKKEDEGNDPPKDEEEDESMDKSDELVKAITTLTEAVNTLNTRMSKEDDEEEEESEEKAKKADEDEDEETEEKSKKARKAEIMEVLVDAGVVQKGGPERPESTTVQKTKVPMSEKRQFAHDKVTALIEGLNVGGDQ
jgi:hypothetical protein